MLGRVSASAAVDSIDEQTLDSDLQIIVPAVGVMLISGIDPADCVRGHESRFLVLSCAWPFARNFFIFPSLLK